MGTSKMIDKLNSEKATMISALSDTIKQDSKQAKQHESMTLSAVIKHYINEKKDSWVHKTKLENEHIFKLALAIIGDKDVADLTHLDFIAYRDILKTLPTNYEKKKEYQDKTMEEIAGIAKDKGDKPISKKTLNKNLQGTSSLMSWCEKHGYVGKNGAKGLAIKDKQNPSDKRKPYNTEDIQRLINSPIYTNGFPVKRPERFWIPLMGLFSGCRLNEICSLYLKDIVETEGVHCFDINYDGDDKHTKTESSVRKVPVHPLLVKIGLLDYVKKLKLKGEQRLFPKLNYTDGNGYGGAFGKWYGRYSRDFITTDKNKVFHSFRRTVADSLKQQGVDYKQIEEILGHKDDSMSTGYYAEPFNPKILFEALKKLDYGLDFSSIKYPVD